MLGNLIQDHKEATVIGGGISGLIAAYRLLKNDYSVTLYEASSKTGGLISTFSTPYGPVETAAHSIRSSQEVLNFFADLNLPYDTAKTKKKYIFDKGRLKSNPLSLWDMFTAGSYAYFKKSSGAPLTVAQWAKDHVGPDALDKIFVPLSHGIYAAEPEELDQQLAFSRFTIPAEQTLVEKIFKGGGQKEKSIVVAPQNGMGDLVDRLTDFIQNHKQGEIRFNTPVESLPDTKNIILATSANCAGTLIGSEKLKNLHYTPMVTVTVFVKSTDAPKLQGIGVLNARGEDQKILGVLFNSLTFDNRVTSSHYVSLTVMMGGTSHPEILSASDPEIENTIAGELKRILGLQNDPLAFFITRWPNAIPLYSSDLRKTLAELKKGWCSEPGHILFGNYTGEVSIRGLCQSSLAFMNP